MRRFCLSATFLVCFLSRSALAQSAGVVSGEELFHDGIQALEAGDWTEACSLFEASKARAQRPSVLVRLGDCYLHDQHFVRAWQTLQSARAMNNEDPARRRPALEEEIVALLAKIPTLQVSLLSRPAGATLTVDGKQLAPEDIGVALPVDLGEHDVLAQAPGYGHSQTTLKVTRAQAHMLALTLLPLDSPQAPSSTTAAAPPTAPPAPRTPRPARPAPHSTGSADRKSAAYLVGAGGIVALGAAATLGVMTLVRVSDSNAHCQYPDGSCDSTGVSLRNQATRLQTAGLIVASTTTAYSWRGLGAPGLAVGGTW